MSGSSRKRSALIVAALVALTSVVVAGALGAALAVTVATDRSGFCVGCHEMRPYHEAWAAGPHGGVECVDCHVERGLVAHLKHKVVALGQVRTHLLGRPTFPLAEAPEVPDTRCSSCHERVVSDRPGFDHDDHARRGACRDCHTGAGHAVSTQTLADAGLLDAGALAKRVSARMVAAGQGADNLAGHVTTVCADCHDMKSMPCKTCHSAKHAARKQDCGTCHTPGPKFVFSHPSSQSCTACHAKPASHSDAECQRCHDKPGVTWAFNHASAARLAECESCHPRPANHRSGECSGCHSTGASWAFAHPRNRSCEKCHARPAGHRSGACSSCHPRGGSTWEFAHPASARCASCHAVPANHYGTACASCHSSSAAWSKASFRHPAIRGGEHTYRSFGCANCHPSGYSSASCAKCHGSEGPNGDD